ncbi:MAG: hypothetical protein CMQ34_08785 [Gammaproteobacteria bacterium]|nr:hypothetical protein [Gammaproteobacteria bacterium]|tara:strand:- start:214 stop:2091 length:1878 start_codon:yes stop_codon:yes gene_type:complete
MRVRKLVIQEFGIKFSLYPNGARTFDDDLLQDAADSVVRFIPDVSAPMGVAPLAYEEDSDIFQKIQLRDNTEYDFSIELPLNKGQFLDKCKNNPLYPFSNESLRDVVKFNGPDSCAELNGNRYRVTGRLNFEGRAGTSYLDVTVEHGTKLLIPVEVLTQKLDYHAEFQQLLHQISEYSAELIIRFDYATETTFGVSSERDSSPMTELMAYRRLFRDGRLVNYLREIMSNPSEMRSALAVKESTAFVVNPDWAKLAESSVDYDFQIGGPLQSFFGGYTPNALPERRIKISFDTDANRFIKSSLTILRTRLEHLDDRMPKKYNASKMAMKQWIRQLELVLLDPFWSGVGISEGFPNSMVLANRKGYREYMMLYLSFGLSLKLETEATLLSGGGDIKPVFQLYEIWCYLMVHNVLCRITCSAGTPELSFLDKDKRFVKELISANDNPISFIYTEDDTVANLSLYYNKTFSRIDDRATQWADSYSGVFNPDISISIDTGSGVVHWIHFDAKYRLDLSQFRRALSSGEPSSSFKREDIHKMHTYRDAVLGTRGSYVLYPGSEILNEIYVRNPNKAYRSSNLVPSVGAFPLKPTSAHEQEEQLAAIGEHIVNCIKLLSKGETEYREELGLS